MGILTGGHIIYFLFIHLFIYLFIYLFFFFFAQYPESHFKAIIRIEIILTINKVSLADPEDQDRSS